LNPGLKAEQWTDTGSTVSKTLSRGGRNVERLLSEAREMGSHIVKQWNNWQKCTDRYVPTKLLGLIKWSPDKNLKCQSVCFF
jgi:hypothetical protein